MARAEQLMQIPAEIVRKCAGFSYDMGGSVMKVVYRTEEDYDEAMANQSPDAKATVRMVMFSRQEMDHGIDFIINNAYIHKGDGDDTIAYTTGVGGYQYKSNLEKELGVKLTNMFELDCFKHAFKYVLTSMPRGEILYPHDDDAMVMPLQEIKASMEPFVELVKSGKTNWTMGDTDLEVFNVDTLMDGFLSTWKNEGDPHKPMAEQADIFPVALGFFGSAFGLMTVDKDYNFTHCDFTPIGGRACLGMAHMFLGCESFAELIELARKGNSDAVDFCTKDIRAESADTVDKDDQGGFYDLMSQDDINSLVYSFGKGVGKRLSDFKREDVAAALIRLYCVDVSMLIDKTMLDFRFMDVKHVFLAGGFPANDVTRYWLTRELTARAAQSCTQMMAKARPTPYQVHFLKHGPHLGALGCLINTVEHLIKPEGESHTPAPEPVQTPAPDPAHTPTPEPVQTPVQTLTQSENDRQQTKL